MEAQKKDPPIPDAQAKAEERSRAERESEKGQRGRLRGAGGKKSNNVRKIRMERMMSKAELARRAGLSTLTVDRVERGMSCRMDTKRKILEALGLKPQDRVMVFGDGEDD
jgi:DNA-binding XRE family transcriptional regulator